MIYDNEVGDAKMTDVNTGWEDEDTLWNSRLGQYIRNEFGITNDDIEARDWNMSINHIVVSGPAACDQWIATVTHHEFKHPTIEGAYWETSGSTIHVHTTVMSVWAIGQFHHQILSVNDYQFPHLGA